MPDAAEAAVAGGDFRLEHRARGFAEQQIGVADDAGAHRGAAVAAARAHRGDAIGKFNFADRPQRFRPAGAVHRAAIDIDGGDDVVAGCDVVGDLLDQIALAAAIPQMMMRIDDRALGVDDFLLAQREPVLARIAVQQAPSMRRHCWWPSIVTPCFLFLSKRLNPVRRTGQGSGTPSLTTH